MDNVLVSVIVCSYNEEKYIQKCLESLINQQGFNGYSEILVLDGMSTDNTRAIIMDLRSKHSNIIFFDNPARVKPPAVNTGFRNAKGKYVAICDAHTVYDDKYLSTLIKVIEELPADVYCVGGPIISLGDNSFGKATALAMSSRIGVGNANHRFSDFEGYAEMACFPLFKREIFGLIGYYDEKLHNHDDEYCYRLRKAGGKVFLTPKAKSYYYVRNKPGTLFKQYYTYGYEQAAVIRKHKNVNSYRQLVPFLFFTALIILIIISLFTGNVIIGLVLPVLYFISLTVYFISALKQNKLKTAILFPVAVFILHFAYAAGFAKGLVSFVLLNKYEHK